YGLAARQLGARSVFLSLLSPAVKPVTPQLSIEQMDAETDVFLELGRMQQTGVFGMYGMLRSPCAFTRQYPLATLAVQQEILPQLVVVTFTNRAADEMQQRTRQQILEDKLPPEIVSAFNRAFFGTIHAFCMKLLTNYGHYLGLPAPLELITDDEDLWQEFVQQQARLGESLSKENREN